jgi:Transcription factor TFIID complex subunit 8 C-term
MFFLDILHLASFARQAMTASRRIQPIPQDFEFALRRALVGTEDLLPHIKVEKNIPTLPPSPPPEEEEELFNAFHGMPVLSKDLSGEDERQQFSYIPAHFPHFPSKHTYRFTPVYTERETDPRKIRELGMEDSRFGEEALRKLARAAFKDTHAAGAGGKGDKRLWGRKQESTESMFEKTVRGLSGKPDAQGKFSLASFDLAPIVNCERDLWRKSAAKQKAEKTDTKDATVAKWVAADLMPS